MAAQHGDVSQEILKVAEDHGCDLLAMATHDRNLLERTFQSSVTHQVVRSGAFPVLAITPEKQSGLSDQPAATTRLLVLLDGSDFAESVLPYVKELGLRLPLEIVLVRWPTSGQESSARVEMDGPVTEGGKGEGRPGLQGPNEATEAHRYLQSVAADLESAGLQVRWEVPEIALNSSRAEVSRLCAGGIIVLASHGRSGLSRWLEGSVAEDLLRDSGCPVLIIPGALADPTGGYSG